MISKILWLSTVLYRTYLVTSKSPLILDRTNGEFSSFSEHATVGFFWLNAAEAWIDVNNDKLNTKVS